MGVSVASGEQLTEKQQARVRGANDSPESIQSLDTYRRHLGRLIIPETCDVAERAVPDRSAARD